MARPYSMDLRERVVQAVEEEGLSRRQAAEWSLVSIATLAPAWINRSTVRMSANRLSTVPHSG